MIYVFKTSVETKLQVKQLKPGIDQALPGATWNFDLTDIDKILRIDSEEYIVPCITRLLHVHNYHCEELE